MHRMRQSPAGRQRVATARDPWRQGARRYRGWGGGRRRRMRRGDVRAAVLVLLDEGR